MSEPKVSSVHTMTADEIIGAVAIIYTHGSLTEQEYTTWVSRSVRPVRIRRG